ncbi:MAG: hypothetical protein ACXWFC_03410 [Nitrososphaeraceae archaeon]
MSKKIKLSLIMYSVIVSMMFMNLGLFQEGLTQNSTNSSLTITNDRDSQEVNNPITEKDNGLANVPLVINITKNSNATDTVIDFIINQVNSSVVDISILEEVAKDRIPLLIDTLKNTNASSIAAEYLLNTTKEGIFTNSTSN